MMSYFRLKTREVLRIVLDPQIGPCNPEKTRATGRILSNSEDGPLRDPGNGLGQERGSFLLVRVFLYGP